MQANHFYFQLTLSLALSILATAYLVPKIISIVRFKKLMDDPNERSSHSNATPSLGGMAFFIVLVLSIYFNQSYDKYGVAYTFYPGLTILLFLGLKDDLVVLSPRTKLIGQIIACLFILVHPRFEISTFHGFFGIGSINPWLGFAIGLFIMIAVINAFNLIDGIDGLAASIGIVAFSGFGIVFFIAGRYFFCLTSVVMVGILIGFLFFNLSSKNKIFMGDTGSMIIGFLIGTMSVRFLALDHESVIRLPFNAIDIPIVLISFLIVPLFDTGRVFVVRLMQGKGVFSPDRNHLHHVLIDGYKVSHRRASFYIAVTNITCVIFFSIILKLTNTYFAFSVLIVVLTVAAIYLHRLGKRVRPLRVVNGKPPRNKQRMQKLKQGHLEPQTGMAFSQKALNN